MKHSGECQELWCWLVHAGQPVWCPAQLEFVCVITTAQHWVLTINNVLLHHAMTVGHTALQASDILCHEGGQATLGGA
jgi:hypothetical protein